VPDDPTSVQGRPVLDDGGYGSRSQFESEVRWRYPTASVQSSWSMTPLASGHGIITPSGLHFERHHAGIPTIDPLEHELILHGMVDEPMRFTMDDLMRLPSVSRVHFIECSGNTLTEWEEPALKTVQGTHGLTSTSEWTGVPLSTVLEIAGLRDGAAWILAEGADAAVMTRSVTVDKALDDAILAYAQNGEALRPEQGYPLRLLLPGFEGNMQIKWLRRLEVSDMPFMTREETSKYTDLMPDGTARRFTFEMDAKSVITFPSGAAMLALIYPGAAQGRSEDLVPREAAALPERLSETGERAPEPVPSSSASDVGEIDLQALMLHIGRPAAQEEVAAVDINVMPDGVGAPAESGIFAEGESTSMRCTAHPGTATICRGYRNWARRD